VAKIWKRWWSLCIFPRKENRALIQVNILTSC
jgi:hypothetical protein